MFKLVEQILRGKKSWKDDSFNFLVLIFLVTEGKNYRNKRI